MAKREKFVKLWSLLYTKLWGLEKKSFAWFITEVGVMYTPSFVKIPDGGLKIPKKLVKLTRRIVNGFEQLELIFHEILQDTIQ